MHGNGSFIGSKEYTTETPEEEFYEDAENRLVVLSDRYSEVREIAQILLLVGGKTVIFDGWGSPKDLENITRVGKFINASDVDTTLAQHEDCEMGYCWVNAALLLETYKNFVPIYTFALNNYYKTCPFWMEHFILRRISSGRYFEATNVDTIEKYFVMDITEDRFQDMMGSPFDDFLSRF